MRQALEPRRISCLADVAGLLPQQHSSPLEPQALDETGRSFVAKRREASVEGRATQPYCLCQHFDAQVGIREVLQDHAADRVDECLSSRFQIDGRAGLGQDCSLRLGMMLQEPMPQVQQVGNASPQLSYVDGLCEVVVRTNI